MRTQYRCGNEHRRAQVRDMEAPPLNGIDYLEVLDTELAGGPLEPLRQRLLLVYFVHNFDDAVGEAPSANQVRIDGGVRVTGIEVERVVRADTIADPAVDEFDQVIAANVDGADRPHVLVVWAAACGDYSSYRLRLTAGDLSGNPPFGFDPALSEAEFSFKVECPSPFDCPEPKCPPEPPSGPVLDYLAKDYSSFRRLMLDRMATIAPEWTERNPGDLGVTVVETLAYAADHLSYRQDATATEAYLDTARLRVSARRHARLLDYPVHDGVNARAWVTFRLKGTKTAMLPRIGTGARPIRLVTRIVENRVTFTADAFFDARSGLHPAVFELRHDVSLVRAHNTIRFYTWGDEACCLPKGATRATLQDLNSLRLHLRRGDVLIFEERKGTGTGKAADADPVRRHAVRLTAVSPEAEEDAGGVRTAGDAVLDPVMGKPVVEIEWAAADALPFPLCLSKRISGVLRKDMSVAVGNVALADHGETLPEAETLPVPGTRLPYRPALAEPDVTHAAPYKHVEAVRRPAAEAFLQDPGKAVAAVRLEGDGQVWLPQWDLLGSSPYAPEFVVEMTEDRTARLRFGDGHFASAPPGEGELIATYRVGSGTAGNVGADAVAHVVTDVAGIEMVRNPLPAVGGVESETLEAVRINAPQAFRVQRRAVTAADYAAMAERHPEVQRAVATRRWTGSWHTMFITVDRKGGRPVDADFEKKLRAHLETFRLAGHDLEIDAPRFISLDIAMTVCVSPRHYRGDVLQALLDVFSNRNLQDGTRGFFHPDNFTFGQPLYLSAVVARAMEVPGVQWVDLEEVPPDGPHRFRRWGEEAHGEYGNGEICMERLEVLRLDNDPSRRENGRVAFLMEGGL